MFRKSSYNYDSNSWVPLHNGEKQNIPIRIFKSQLKFIVSIQQFSSSNKLFQQCHALPRWPLKPHNCSFPASPHSKIACIPIIRLFQSSQLLKNARIYHHKYKTALLEALKWIFFLWTSEGTTTSCNYHIYNTIDNIFNKFAEMVNRGMVGCCWWWLRIHGRTIPSDE